MSRFCWYNFRNLLCLSQADIQEVGMSIRIPLFYQKQVIELCEETISILKKEQIVLRLKSPLNIIGDLHGNFIDLLRIFSSRKPPPRGKYLFLGDFVDRGQFSIETILMLFTLKCTFPDSIFLIRGNHEFFSINSLYGFQKEVECVYGNDHIFRKINEVFTWLPLVAIVNDSYFCVHGGISPLLTDLSQLEKMERPILEYSGDDEDSRIICDLLWSDPNDTHKGFSSSPRGIGTYYGYQAVANFLMHNKLKHIFRAHQSVIKGIADHCNAIVTTVFSSSFITPTRELHFCGIIYIDSKSNVVTFTMAPMREPLFRILACFNPSAPQHLESSMDTPSSRRFQMKFNDINDHHSYNGLYSRKRKSPFSIINSNSTGGNNFSSLALFNKNLFQSGSKGESSLPQLK